MNTNLFLILSKLNMQRTTKTIEKLFVLIDAHMCSFHIWINKTMSIIALTARITCIQIAKRGLVYVQYNIIFKIGKIHQPKKGQ